jgi:nicotinate-nucleotide adenylyltransferase
MLALLGGTFDPIHLGHLDLARRVCDAFSLSELAFVPAGRNPLKREKPGASAEQRLEMAALAIQEAQDRRFSVLDIEAREPGPSYTILTVSRCLAQGRPVTLVMGNEVFRDLEAWKQPERLLSLADLIVVTRDSGATADIPGVLHRLGIVASETQPSRFEHGRDPKSIRSVTAFPFTALPYSATRIRGAWAEYWKSGEKGEMPRGTGFSVQAYIKQNHLYAVS